jgi:hypothetical protein
MGKSDAAENYLPLFSRGKEDGTSTAHSKSALVSLLD